MDDEEKDVLLAPGESFSGDSGDSTSTNASGWAVERPTRIPVLAGLAILVIVGGAIYGIVNAGPEEIDEPTTIDWGDGLSSVRPRTVGEVGHLNMDLPPDRVREMASAESGSEVAIPVVVVRQVTLCTVRLSPTRIRSIRCPVSLRTEVRGPGGLDATVDYLEAKYGDSTHLGQVPARTLDGSSAGETDRLTAWQWKRDDLEMTLFAKREDDTTDEVAGVLVVERSGPDSDDSPDRESTEQGRAPEPPEVSTPPQTD